MVALDFGVGGGDPFQVLARQAALRFDSPTGGRQIGGESGKALRVLGNKGVIHGVALCFIQLQQRFGDAFERAASPPALT